MLISLDRTHVMVFRRVARRRQESLDFNIILASTLEPLTFLLANNKAADQPAHLRSLISAFVILYLKGKVTKSKYLLIVFRDGRQHDKVSGYAPGVGSVMLWPKLSL